tara:strand:- start:1275 stop:2207 length:933 start_codon:yes stop_codon:yes gene_type:complete
MKVRAVKIFSWIIGLFMLCMLFLWIDFKELSRIFTQIGFMGVVIWALITLFVRLLYAEITVLPLSVFEAKISRMDAFWIGWVRTFANQILPLSGLAVYIKAIKDRAGVSWSEISALATPQFFISAMAVSLLGMISTVIALDIEDFGLILLVIYSVIFIISLVLILQTPYVMRAFPSSLSKRLISSADAFEKISSSPKLILLLVIYYCGVILLRVVRLWLLFMLAGQELDWQTALILGVIAESTLIIQLTPGGIGLREGSILAGAVFMGVDGGLAASVAIIDRLLVVSMTVVFVLPSGYFLWLGRPKVVKE